MMILQGMLFSKVDMHLHFFPFAGDIPVAIVPKHVFVVFAMFQTQNSKNELIDHFVLVVLR